MDLHPSIYLLLVRKNPHNNSAVQYTKWPLALLQSQRWKNIIEPALSHYAPVLPFFLVKGSIWSKVSTKVKVCHAGRNFSKFESSFDFGEKIIGLFYIFFLAHAIYITAATKKYRITKWDSTKAAVHALMVCTSRVRSALGNLPHYLCTRNIRRHVNEQNFSNSFQSSELKAFIRSQPFC